MIARTALVSACVLVCALEAKAAAATSAVIVTGSGLSGFLAHLPTADLHWDLTLATALAVLVGSQVGSRLMARKLKSRAVRVVFGVVLLGVATALFLQGVLHR